MREIKKKCLHILQILVLSRVFISLIIIWILNLLFQMLGSKVTLSKASLLCSVLDCCLKISFIHLWKIKWVKYRLKNIYGWYLYEQEGCSGGQRTCSRCFWISRCWIWILNFILHKYGLSHVFPFFRFHWFISHNSNLLPQLLSHFFLLLKNSCLRFPFSVSPYMFILTAGDFYS